MQKSLKLWAVTCALCAVAATGCLERKGGAVGPNVGFGQEVSIGYGGVTTVDVLLVIDNSNSMRQEQQRLSDQIGRLVRDLAEPPDRDGDGSPDWNAVEELRIGVTTTDVGTGQADYCMGDGDDGQLQGGVFEFNAGEDADAYAAEIAAVVAGLGVMGCGFEQPLEAAARAVVRGGIDSRDRPFPSDTGLLAVVLVTDEEDCSVEDDTGFFGAAAPGALNVHCTRNASALTPVSGLVSRIRGARSADDLLFAAIAGIPTDLDTTSLSPEEILAAEGMAYVEREEPGVGGRTDLRLTPACVVPNPAGGEPLTRADPARRLVELAQLVPDTTLHTICNEDFGPAIAEIAARIGAKVPGVCLVREVPGGLGSSVPCDLTVTLPVGERCDAWPAHTLVDVTSDDQQVCRMAQAPGGAGEGFYYDPEADGCAQLVITEAAQPPVGSVIEAECFFTLLLENGELCARASQCASGWCDAVTDQCADLPPEMSGPLGP